MADNASGTNTHVSTSPQTHTHTYPSANADRHLASHRDQNAKHVDVECFVEFSAHAERTESVLNFDSRRCCCCCCLRFGTFELVGRPLRAEETESREICQPMIVRLFTCHHSGNKTPMLAFNSNNGARSIQFLRPIAAQCRTFGGCVCVVRFDCDAFAPI